MNYVYSTTPVPSVDTLNSHTGFYVVAAIMAVYYIYVWFASEGDVGPKITNALGVLVILAISAAVSWNTGTVAHYANTPVTATRVDFLAEGWSESRVSGKTRTRADVHVSYVIYELADGARVMFRADPTVAYPVRATLYRNPRAQ